MDDPNKIIPKYQMILGLMLGLSGLVTGGLAMSSERAVILTQRFVPDAVHNVPLTLKGKIFYVTTAESASYYFYQRLFLAMIGLGWMIAMCKFMWEGYKETREIRRSRIVSHE